MEIYRMSLAASVFILAIVIIRALALHRIPKMTFVVLWTVALFRLLIPFFVPTPFSIYNLLNRLKMPFSTVDTSVKTVTGMTPINIGTVAHAINTSLAKTASVNISPFIVVWFVGLSACAMFFLVTHLRWRRGYKTALPVDNEFARVWQRSYPTRRKVEIRQSDRIAAPLAYGIVRPVILLPKGMDWTHEKHLEYVLMHELVHIRRFDPLLKLLLVVAVCVHWFNPFVWGMYVLANRDIELACDEAVVRTFGESMKSAYALTLIGLEEKRSSVMPLVNNFSKNSIEERIVAIMKMKKASVIGVVAAVLIVAGATVAFATEAKNSTGSYNPAKPLEASTTLDSAAGLVQPNQVESQGWKLTVTKTVIGKLANDQTKKVAGVYISLTNNLGPDKAFSPKGKIAGVIGGSGKFYKIDWLNSFDTMYSKGQRTMKMAAKEEGKPYYPGVFKFAAQLYIDAGEQNLAQLVYEDDNGTKLDIPIQGAPEVPKSTPGGR